MSVDTNIYFRRSKIELYFSLLAWVQLSSIGQQEDSAGALLLSCRYRTFAPQLGHSGLPQWRNICLCEWQMTLHGIPYSVANKKR